MKILKFLSAGAMFAVGLAASGAAQAEPDVELECAMHTGSQNVEAYGTITLSPNGSWRLSFNPSRRTVTMKKWFAYNAPAVTEQPTSVSITADQIKFCVLASGCGDNGMVGFVEIDRRTRELQWNYIVGLERENGPMFRTVMYGKCDLFTEKPQAF
ncbi:hypothetical protein [Caulobacter sp. 17J80-11]|uniref:hypothetical protein n=1 Tax=Caulobacter sp. 17J80-11 TaxID=2763502 RepID=UPI0016539DBB|nr:hypothetical protein [Caulobacter sp. 17J80-11]MBC6981318.1 hypothetical protein [Caulobacter sp. 17J80-11]